MIVALKNLERHSMLFVGDLLTLTPDKPGPVNVDVGSLTKQEAFQILFNIKRGVLSTDDDLSALEGKLNIPPPGMQEKGPVGNPDLELKSLLSKSVNTVKKEASNLSIGKLRKLIEMEASSKKRKSLLAFLNNLNASHQKEVTSKIELAEKGPGREDLSPQVFLDDLPDVVESEEEDIDIPLP